MGNLIIRMLEWMYITDWSQNGQAGIMWMRQLESKIDEKIPPCTNEERLLIEYLDLIIDFRGQCLKTNPLVHEHFDSIRMAQPDSVTMKLINVAWEQYGKKS